MELLLGCGNRKEKQFFIEDNKEWKGLVALDIDPDVNPDYCFDLDSLSLGNHFPFVRESFDEIHAYNVLEHIGRQGDWKGFFKEFSEYHRVLKPEGLFFIVVPSFDSEWALGDPGHTRVFTPGTWSFFDQDIYAKDVGVSPMTDYRYVWKGNFKVVHYQQQNKSDYIILKKEKYNAETN